MSSSVEWLPAKSKVASSSHTWQIKKFSQQKFDTEISEPRFGGERKHIKGLHCSNLMFSFMRGEDCEKIRCSLWLTRDTIGGSESNSGQLSPWLRLTLTTENHVLLRLSELKSNDNRNVCVAWIISDGQRRRQVRLTGGAFRLQYTTSHFAFTNPNFVLCDDLFDEEKHLMPDDTLTIVCQLQAFTNDISYVDSWLFQSLKPAVNVNKEHTLVKDLKRMLESGQGSDVTLVASDGQQFPAHQSILSSRSPVFAAMFDHDTKEKQEKRVTIDDLSSKAVKSLLEFVYTDKVANITTLAPELFPAAQKYDIARMKTLCEEAMMSQLKIDNAAELFLLADLYAANQLRPAAKQFIVTNIQDVRRTEGWKTLQNQRPQLTEELFDELAELMSVFRSRPAST